MRQSSIVMAVLVLLALAVAFLEQLPLFAALGMQFCLGFTLYFAYRNWQSLVVIALVSYVYDIAAGLPPGLSMLIFSAVGLGLTLVNLFLPLLRKQPFWVGKNLWLFGCVLILNFAVVGYDVGAWLGRLPLVIVVNLLVGNLLILVTRNTSAANSNAEIVVS